MELGVFTFGEVVNSSPEQGRQRMQELLAEIELADQVGLDVFGVGEHHRPEYLISTPAVVLAAAAARTKRIRLTSTVTVLSSDDPVRVFQEFATVDLISNGRAEIMAGRGSFIESFPLFGYDLEQYDSLFSSKVELLLKLREHEIVSWAGKHRATIDRQGIYPRPYQSPLPVWIAVGGTPASVVRAGKLGLPLAVAIIGGAWSSFAPLIEHYRSAVRQAGHAPLPVSINSHGYIAPSSQQAADESYPHVVAAFNKIGRERGWGAMGRMQFEQLRSPQGAFFIGSPQEVTEKILAQHELFRNERFMLQFGVGAVGHAERMRTIELFGTIVAPAVRTALAN
ncbi:MAG: LLM class flavin-dependent oxidoreductase [Roseiflexaceae bacterium]